MLRKISAEIVEIHVSEFGEVCPQPSAKDHLGLHGLVELGVGKDLVSQEIAAEFSILCSGGPMRPTFVSEAMRVSIWLRRRCERFDLTVSGATGNFHPG